MIERPATFGEKTFYRITVVKFFLTFCFDSNVNGGNCLRCLWCVMLIHPVVVEVRNLISTGWRGAVCTHTRASASFQSWLNSRTGQTRSRAAPLRALTPVILSEKVPTGEKWTYCVRNSFRLNKSGEWCANMFSLVSVCIEILPTFPRAFRTIRH